MKNTILMLVLLMGCAGPADPAPTQQILNPACGSTGGSAGGTVGSGGYVAGGGTGGVVDGTGGQVASGGTAGMVLTGDPCTTGTVVEVAPGQNLQAAVTAAADGNVIHVQAGNYNAFTVNNKHLTVCCDTGAVITGSNAMTTSALATGNSAMYRCEIKGGSPGLTLKGYSFLLDHVNVHHNPGGGVVYNQYPVPSSVTMQSVTIADHVTGRGIIAGATTTVIKDSFILRNDAGSASGSDGGGAHFDCGAATITNTLFEGNHAYIGGALAMAAYNCAGSGTITGSGNTTRANSCVKHTGGWFTDGAIFTLDHEQATGNTGGTEAGGAYACDGSTNTGGVKRRGTLKCTNCSVTGNGTFAMGQPYPGGGFLTRSTDAPCDIEVVDSIVWGNTGTDFGSLSGSGGLSTMTITHTDWAAQYPTGLPAGWTHTMDLNVNPLWVTPPTDLHLQAGSPVSAVALAPAPGLGVYP
jgi:hypothetical protein